MSEELYDRVVIIACDRFLSPSKRFTAYNSNWTVFIAQSVLSPFRQLNFSSFHDIHDTSEVYNEEAAFHAVEVEAKKKIFHL